METYLLPIKWNSEGSSLYRAYPADAGIDLIYYKSVVLKPKQITLVETDLIIQIPTGYCGIVKARSSTYKKSLSIIDGVIDAGYCGTIKLQIRNESDNIVELPENTRIAQILFLPVPEVSLIKTDTFDLSQRGNKGLGSSNNEVKNG